MSLESSAGTWRKASIAASVSGDALFVRVAAGTSPATSNKRDVLWPLNLYQKIDTHFFNCCQFVQYVTCTKSKSECKKYIQQC